MNRKFAEPEQFSVKMFFGLYYVVKSDIPEYSGIYKGINNEGNFIY